MEDRDIEYIEFALAVGAAHLVVNAIPDPHFMHNLDDPTQTDRLRGAILLSLDDMVPVAREAALCLKN